MLLVLPVGVFVVKSASHQARTALGSIQNIPITTVDCNLQVFFSHLSSKDQSIPETIYTYIFIFNICMFIG